MPAPTDAVLPVRLVCLGNSAWDRSYFLDAMPAGEAKLAARAFTEGGGGMAANAACAVARLGGTVQLWSRAGRDATAEAMRAELERFGVDVAHFRFFEGCVSPQTTVLVDAQGRRTTVTFRDPGLPRDPSWLPLAELTGVKAVLGDIRWPEGTEAVFRAARRRGIPTILDVEPVDPALLQILLPLTEHVIFSEAGLRSTLGEMGLSDGLVRARQAGPRLAAVTRGEKGVLWLEGDELRSLAAYRVPVADTTGAGDAFHGAYALGVAQERMTLTSMRFASAVAALKCSQKGSRAGLPTQHEVLVFMAEQVVKDRAVKRAPAGA
jgi:sulfofructose kinase